MDCWSSHQSYKTIHVAGTNGKGLLLTFSFSIAEASYKTGLYTSPHLIDFRERVKIDIKKFQKASGQLY